MGLGLFISHEMCLLLNEFPECPENVNCTEQYVNFHWKYQVGWKTGMEANGKQAGHTDVYFYHKEERGGGG